MVRLSVEGLGGGGLDGLRGGKEGLAAVEGVDGAAGLAQREDAVADLHDVGKAYRIETPRGAEGGCKGHVCWIVRAAESLKCLGGRLTGMRRWMIWLVLTVLWVVQGVFSAVSHNLLQAAIKLCAAAVFLMVGLVVRARDLRPRV